MQTRRKIRIFLLMLAFGLASVPFANGLYDRWTEVYVDLPQTESVSPIVVTPEPTPTKEFLYKRSLISKERDLSQFDDGGEFTNQCFSQDDIKGCEKKRIEARKFIFNHWKEKKRAYILYIVVGTDCVTESHIFIEPNETGKWRIVFVDEFFGFGVTDDNLDLFEATSVKYKRATKDDHPFDVGSYYLSFLDEKEEEIFGL